MKEHGASSLFDGVMLNSPFFDFNKSWFVKKCLPFVALGGGFLPGIKIAGDSRNNMVNFCTGEPGRMGI